MSTDTMESIIVKVGIGLAGNELNNNLSKKSPPKTPPRINRIKAIFIFFKPIFLILLQLKLRL